MSKERFIALLTKDFVNELLPGEAAELHSLIANNAEYARQYELFRTYWSEKDLDYSRDQAMFKKISSKISEYDGTFTTPKSPVPTIPRHTIYWKAAAAVLIIACAFFFYTSKPDVNQVADKSNWTVKTTSRGLKKTFILPDGTHVTMNADSKLSYPLSFKGGIREVHLSGEAFFDVAEDHRHPFIIHTGKMNIKVLGTAFNVKSYPEDEASETTLLRGSIEVTLTDRPADRIILKPTEKLVVNYSRPNKDLNEKFSLPDGTNALTKITYFHTRDTTIMETSWLQNKLIFNDEDFNSLARQMERKYNVEIDFKNEELKRLRFTGMFEQESLEDALKTLQLLEGFKFERSDNTIKLY